MKQLDFYLCSNVMTYLLSFEVFVFLPYENLFFFSKAQHSLIIQRVENNTSQHRSYTKRTDQVPQKAYTTSKPKAYKPEINHTTDHLHPKINHQSKTNLGLSTPQKKPDIQPCHRSSKTQKIKHQSKTKPYLSPPQKEKLKLTVHTFPDMMI